MQISNCGYDYRHEASYTAERPHGSTGHILMIIRSPARIDLNGQVHYINGNNVIIYRKKTPQFFYAHNTEFVNDWVRFDLEEADFTFLEAIGVPFDTIMEFADVYPLSRFIKMMAIEKWSSSPNAQEASVLLLRLLFLKLSDYIASKPILYSQLTEKLTILKNNIYSTPQNDWSIDNICKNIAISPSHLQHKYKQLFGNSIKEDITQSRIQYSKWLLSNTSHTVAVISRMCGYNNDISFMSIFKKKTGFTPSQYRSSMGKVASR